MNLNKLNFVWILILSLGVAISCSKDDDDDDTPAGADLMVNIDGQAWSGDITELVQGGSVTLTANSGLFASVQLLMPTDTVGTFNLADLGPFGVQYVPNIGQAFNDIQSGTLVITQNSSSKRSGTFNAVIASTTNPTDTVVMTNGSFSTN